MLKNHYIRFDGNQSDDLIYKLETAIFDKKLQMRGSLNPEAKIGILAIDEKSINQFGRPPISRQYYKKAFENLKKHGVQWIGMDVIFSEDERMSVDDISPRLKEIISSESKEENLTNLLEILNGKNVRSVADQSLFEGISDFKNVVMGFFYFKAENEANDNLGPVNRYEGLAYMQSSEIEFLNFPEGKSLSDYNKPIKPAGIVSNTDYLSSASEHFSFFSNEADGDAINRWATLVANINGVVLPSLSLKTAVSYLNRGIEITFDEIGVSSIRLYDKEDWSAETIDIPVDPLGLGRVLINHRGPSRTFPHFSLADAYNDTFTAEQKSRLKDSILLLGATATGTNDIRPNPFDAMIDGVENHAAVIDNIINQDFYKRPLEIFSTERNILLAVGISSTFLFSILSPVGSGILLILTLGAIFLSDYFYYFNDGVWLYTGVPSLLLLLIFGLTIFHRFAVEQREKRQIRGVFQHYLSPEVIDDILSQSGSLGLGGARKDLTVFFSDVRSFTTISESLTPEKLSDVMNRYFTPMTSIILQSKGVLDKYIGDAIMAFWGAPLKLENHPDIACTCSLAMLDELDRLREEFAKEGLPAIDIGIGLNTGPMSVGNMGSEERFTYTVMGDSVNLGSRLEGLTKDYGVKIIISEYTYEKITKEIFYTRELDDIRVKGKNIPVRIYELIRPKSFKSEAIINDFIASFSKGRQAYLRQNWDEALDCFSRCLEIKSDDKASQLYIDRIEQFKIESPGINWDGVFVFNHK